MTGGGSDQAGAHDPGWTGAWRGALLVPVIIVLPVLFSIVRRWTDDGLRLIRTVFVTYAVAGALIGLLGKLVLVSGGLEDRSGGRSLAAVCASVAVGAMVAVGGFAGFASQPLVPGPAPDLASTYRRRLFLRLAFADVPVVIGFIGLISAADYLPFAIGGVFSAAMFVWAAPTRAALRREQAGLDDRGGSPGLIEALQVLPSAVG